MSTINLDNYTGAVGTNLNGRVPDIGPACSVTDGTAQLDGSGHAIFTAVGASTYGIAVYDAGKSDGAAQVTLRFLTGAQFRRGLALRSTGGNNHWRVVLHPTNNTFDIAEVNGGTQTVRATTPFAVSLNTDYVISAVLSGATITATVNGGNTISWGSANTTNPNTTTHGLDCGDNTTPNSGRYSGYIFYSANPGPYGTPVGTMFDAGALIGDVFFAGANPGQIFGAGALIGDALAS